MMQVFIRVDASVLIGSGHVMRCLTLSDMLKKEGHKIVFVCRDLPGNLSSYIEVRGYPCELLPYTNQQKYDYLNLPANDDYGLWRGVPVDQDAKEVIEATKEKAVDLLVIDHYGIDTNWEKQLRPIAQKIMVIDDLANRKHDCDILLDHNFYVDYENRYNALVSKECKKLLGPKHALINPKLKRVKETRQELGKGLVVKEVNNLVIFLGGMDVKNYTQKAIDKVLSNDRFSKAVIHVVLGQNNPNKVALKQKYADKDNVVFHIQPNYYYELLEKADLAVGAGGVSQLERSFVELPSLVVAVADNQRAIYNDMVVNKHTYPSEAMDISSLEGLEPLDISLFELTDIAFSSSNKQGRDYCIIRNVEESDTKTLYYWRNHPETTKYFFSQEPLLYIDHVVWLKESLKKTNRFMYILEDDHIPVGTIRFDLNDRTEAIVDIYTDPRKQGKGYGKLLLKYGVERLKADNSGVTKVIAEVINGNTASERLFLSSKFKKTYQTFELGI